MKKSALFITSIIGFAAIFAACGEGPVEVEHAALITTISNVNAEDTATDKSYRTPTGSAHSGQFAYRTDSVNPYSGGLVYYVPDSLLNVKARIIADFWVKTSNPLKGDGLAISFQDEVSPQASYYGSFDLSSYNLKANEWTNVKDSVTIDLTPTNPKMFFKIFGFNSNRKAVIDFDDINISIKKVYTTVE